jgi:hypothetical protein
VTSSDIRGKLIPLRIQETNFAVKHSDYGINNRRRTENLMKKIAAFEACEESR